jgi:hypothetical protein
LARQAWNVKRPTFPSQARGPILPETCEAPVTHQPDSPTKGAWSARALPGASFACHVTPRARKTTLAETPDGSLRATVTAAPEDGRANAAVAELLAHALGVAKTRLTLIKGATSRDKVFRLDD